MATPFEAFPDDSYNDEPLEPDVAAHVGRVSHAYGEEEAEIPPPGNFPIVLHAYILNRFGHEPESFNVQTYQKILRDFKVGQFITQALDTVYNLDRASIIDPALMSPMRETEETNITHAIVIQEALPYLPQGVEQGVFRDPTFEDEVA